MTDKKRKSGNVSYNVMVDSEDGEILDFFWNEDHEPPPLIKPKKKKGEGPNEKERKN